MTLVSVNEAIFFDQIADARSLERLGLAVAVEDIEIAIQPRRLRSEQANSRLTAQVMYSGI